RQFGPLGPAIHPLLVHFDDQIPRIEPDFFRAAALGDLGHDHAAGHGQAHGPGLLEAVLLAFDAVPARAFALGRRLVRQAEADAQAFALHAEGNGLAGLDLKEPGLEVAAAADADAVHGVDEVAALEAGAVCGLAR